MGDPLTVTLNLTFLGTVGIGFVMFAFVFLMFVLTLLIAGVGRLAALLAMVIAGRSPRQETIPVIHVNDAGQRQGADAVRAEARPAAVPAARPKEMAPDWAAAVAAADAREAEREKSAAKRDLAAASTNGAPALREQFPEGQRKAS